MSTDPTKISAQPPPAEQANSKNLPETSKGERLFDWLTYGGFAGGVTFLLSLPLGYLARYSRAGQKSIQVAAHHLEKVGMSHGVAEDAIMTTALMQGGNLALVPVKLMENNKPELVAKFNRALGDNSGDCSVEQEPKQTWSSLLKSRAFAWTAVFLSLSGAAKAVGREKFGQFEEKFSEQLLCKPLGHPTHINGMETKVYRIGRIAAIDSFATAAAAALLYTSSRIFAKESGEKWERLTAHTPLNGNTSAEDGNIPQDKADDCAKPAASHRAHLKPRESFVQLTQRPSESLEIPHAL